MKRKKIKNKVNWEIKKHNYFFEGKNKTTLNLSNNDHTTDISIYLEEDGTAYIDLNSFDQESKKHPKVLKSTRKLKSISGGTFKLKESRAIFDKMRVSLKKFIR
tara:strand:+ start:288 stop:599 length:312 start_codon:yes stop_codon:yes gene_type:complete